MLIPSHKPPSNLRLDQLQPCDLRLTLKRVLKKIGHHVIINAISWPWKLLCLRIDEKPSYEHWIINVLMTLMGTSTLTGSTLSFFFRIIYCLEDWFFGLCLVYVVMYFAISTSASYCVFILFFEWLYSPCGPWPLFQSPNLFTIGRTRGANDQLITRPLPKHRTAHTQNKHIYTPNIRDLSGIRTHGHSVRASEDSSCFRPRGYCDRHCVFILYTCKF
jgi:hypothetical protein